MAAKKEIFEINVYDDENKIVKTCHAVDCSLKFGAVRKIMALLNVDNIDDSAQFFKAVYGAWEELTKILTTCFPDMDESDWDNVNIEDLIPVVYGILKTSFNKILGIPKESKN